MTSTDTVPSTVPASRSEQTVSLPDGDLHVTDEGPRGAPALLLVHGSVSSGRSWDQVAPSLAARYRVVRADLLGHGRSAKPADASYTVPDQARRLAEVLDRLGIGSVLVVGHSSGGIVATALAELRPGLVRALALVDTGPSLGSYLDPPAGGLAPGHWPPTDDELRAAARTALASDDVPVPDVLVEDARRMELASLGAITAATTAYLADEPLPDRLAPLGKPLLVLFGELDRRWAPASADDYAVVPGATVTLLAGVGHSPILENPARTAAILLDFADAVERVG
ncbi:alpha/beta hydrolase [Luteimicrobium album]|uniref:Alpha/beta hydrolase n=1 Tax=Luteimicrobium album TaxID=1054550 RepID=A0ABQ6HZP7_9MICO|nr:alpha/beta hydrolase [Luteimicrobium album]GMA23476.1 alpha/beta hydrolase [Luteimicrobium album]